MVELLPGILLDGRIGGRTDAFIEWMGDTRIIYEPGCPLETMSAYFINISLNAKH